MRIGSCAYDPPAAQVHWGFSAKGPKGSSVRVDLFAALARTMPLWAEEAAAGTREHYGSRGFAGPPEGDAANAREIAGSLFLGREALEWREWALRC
jgi:hypothetical protein